MITYYIILLLFIAMVTIFVGLHLSKDIENSTLLVLFWIIYSLITATFFNVFLLGYFWSVVRKKTGPTGIRGSKGNIGENGRSGKCVGNSNQNIAVFQIIEYLDKIHKLNLIKLDLDTKNSNYSILKKDNNLQLINNYMDKKIRLMVFSNQFESLLEVLPIENMNLDNNELNELGDTPNQNNKKQLSLNYLISYLQQIVSEWYHLIYKSKSDWFYNQYDDMKADWTGDDPFIEIRKYDVFYWGTQRAFKPLKVEVCQDIPGNYRDPKIHTLLTNDYELAYDDAKSGTSKRMNIWRPKKVTNVFNDKEVTFYPIGDVITSGDPSTFNLKNTGKTIIGDSEIQTGKSGNGPSKTTLLVAEGSENGDILADPIKYEEMWKHEKKVSVLDGSYEIDKLRDEGRIWKPVGPEGYTCLGDIASNKYNPNNIKQDLSGLSGTELEEAKMKMDDTKEEYLKYNNSLPELKCIKNDCLEEIPIENLDKRRVWYSKQGENNIKYNGEVYTIGNSINGKAENSYNTFRADNYFYFDHKKALDADRDRSISDYEHSRVVGPDGGKFYRIKDECLKQQEFVPKKIDQDNADIGIGWYGLPSNKESKYSIFHWMGLIPEGMITNSYAKKKLYVIHYGGPKLNVYNVLVYDNTTGKYSHALESSDLKKIKVRKLQKNNNKQQFKIIKNNQLKDIIHLENIFSPRKYLSIGNDNTVENNYSLSRTRDVTTRFKFEGAFNSLDTLK